MEIAPAAAANLCQSVENPASVKKENKTQAVGRRALLRLSQHSGQEPRRDVKPAADLIESELKNCFQPADKQKAQAAILEWMRKTVCLEDKAAAAGLPDHVLVRVDIQDVNQVGRYLGNEERLDCKL